MKNNFLRRASLFLALCAFVFTACEQENIEIDQPQVPYSPLAQQIADSQDDAFDATPSVAANANDVEFRDDLSIVEYLSFKPDLSILVQAASRFPGLVEVLSDPETQITLFAPTNDAFVALLQAAGFASLDDVPDEMLMMILSNHVLANGDRTGDNRTGIVELLPYEPSLATANGGNVSNYYNVTGQNTAIINGDINVVRPNQFAGRSLIHVVDKVITIPSIVTFATTNPDFSILVDALVRADLVGALQGDGPFTVAAPTNMAFMNLLQALGASSLDDIPLDLLTTVLLYHVSTDVVGLEEDGVVNTLATDADGNALDYRVDGDMITADQNMANIAAGPLYGSNGVVYAIDTVILPE